MQLAANRSNCSSIGTLLPIYWWLAWTEAEECERPNALSIVIPFRRLYYVGLRILAFSLKDFEGLLRKERLVM